MMMQQPGSVGFSPSMVLPLLFQEEEMDFKAMFLLTTMTQQSCDKTGQMNMILPLLMQVTFFPIFHF